jgi:hypothetical protein
MSTSVAFFSWGDPDTAAIVVWVLGVVSGAVGCVVCCGAWCLIFGANDPEFELPDGTAQKDFELAEHKKFSRRVVAAKRGHPADAPLRKKLKQLVDHPVAFCSHRRDRKDTFSHQVMVPFGYALGTIVFILLLVWVLATSEMGFVILSFALLSSCLAFYCQRRGAPDFDDSFESVEILFKRSQVVYEQGDTIKGTIRVKLPSQSFATNAPSIRAKVIVEAFCSSRGQKYVEDNDSDGVSHGVDHTTAARISFSTSANGTVGEISANDGVAVIPFEVKIPENAFWPPYFGFDIQNMNVKMVHVVRVETNAAQAERYVIVLPRRVAAGPDHRPFHGFCQPTFFRVSPVTVPEFIFPGVRCCVTLHIDKPSKKRLLSCQHLYVDFCQEFWHLSEGVRATMAVTHFDTDAQDFLDWNLTLNGSPFTLSKPWGNCGGCFDLAVPAEPGELKIEFTVPISAEPTVPRTSMNAVANLTGSVSAEVRTFLSITGTLVDATYIPSIPLNVAPRSMSTPFENHMMYKKGGECVAMPEVQRRSSKRKGRGKSRRGKSDSNSSSSEDSSSS